MLRALGLGIFCMAQPSFFRSALTWFCKEKGQRN